MLSCPSFGNNPRLTNSLRANGSSRNPMLSCPSFGNNPRLTNSLRQQRLSNRIINLMRTGMCQILPLQPNLRPSRVFRQPFRKMQRGWPSYKVLPILREFSEIFRIIFDEIVLFFNFTECVGESLGYKLSSEFTKVSFEMAGCRIHRRWWNGAKGSGLINDF